MKQKSDKRKSIRKSCLVPVDGKKGASFDHIQTVDIGQGGVGLISHKYIPKNESIAIEIELGPQEEPVIVMGKVQWIRSIPGNGNFRIGMKFQDVLLAGSKSRLKHCFPE
jgi:hypothetical protein